MRNTTVVYSTTTESARRHRSALAGIARVASAPQPWLNAYTSGLCTRCGAVETVLTDATGTRDFSHLGEAPDYPTGYGCELCD
jgi:hypothetical protein